MDEQRWIEIPNWDRFQHYRDRRPAWVKAYVSLLTNVDYRALTGHQRAVLLGIWLMYASNSSRLAVDTASLTRAIGLRVSEKTIDALEQAGFVRIVLAPRYQEASDLLAPKTETERESVLKTDRSEIRGRDELSVSGNGSTTHDRLLNEIHDADERTAVALRAFARTLPESAFAEALESLRSRRRKPGGKLASEARYVIATLSAIGRER